MEEKKPSQVVEKGSSVEKSTERSGEEGLKELLSIPGLSESKAKLLYDAGFTTISEIENARIQDLLKVDGINGKTVGNILDEWGAEPKEKEEEKQLNQVAGFPDLTFKNDLSHYSAGYADLSKLKKAKIDDLLKIEGFERKPVSSILREWGLRTAEPSRGALLPKVEAGKVDEIRPIVETYESKIAEEIDMTVDRFVAEYIESLQIESMIEESMNRIADEMGRTLEVTASEYLGRFDGQGGRGIEMQAAQASGASENDETDPAYGEFIRRMTEEITRTMDSVVAEHIERIETSQSPLKSDGPQHQN